MSLSLVARRGRLLHVRTLIDADGGGAMHFHVGAMAAAPEAAPDSPPIAIVALAPVSFELHATAAEMTLVPAQGNAAVSGQPTWVRFVDGSGIVVLDRTAGPPGSGAQVIVTDGKDPPSAFFFTGGEVNVTATMSEP